MARLAYFGSSVFSVPTLETLVRSTHQVVCVYSQPPKAARRGQKETKTPLHQRAGQLGLEVMFLPTDTDEAILKLKNNAVDLALVASFGRILAADLLEVPKFGFHNIHASVLPRWRGAAPIHRAILAGDTETGISFIRMTPPLDAGPIGTIHRCSVFAQDTSDTLTSRLAQLGSETVLDHIEGVLARSIRFQPQDECQITYAHKIRKSEALIDFRSPCQTIERMVRAFTPTPGAFFFLESGSKSLRMIVRSVTLHPDSASLSANEFSFESGWRVGCGVGALRLETIQPEGKRPMSAEAFVRGIREPERLRIISDPSVCT